MTIERAHNGDVEIAYETVGSTDGAPLLLVMGIGGQMLSWPEGFCRLLVQRGFRVARLDNRDAGLSTHLEHAGTPNQLTMLLRPAAAGEYGLTDMADDAVAVLDDLGWTSAHVAGMSQGGMIAQTMALRHPTRVRSLTSISSTPGARIGQPSLRTLAKVARVANPKRVRTAKDLERYLVNQQQITGSPAYPADEEHLRELAPRLHERGGIDMASVQRQTAAIAAAGDRRDELSGVQVPTLVVHGQDDRIIRVEAATATADAIAGARLVTYPGMGHELPAELHPRIVEEIMTLAGLAGEYAGAGGQD